MLTQIIIEMKLINTLFFVFFLVQFSTAQESFVKYKVNKGETVTQISKKFNISINEIYDLNPDAVNGIQENQVIYLSVVKLVKHEVMPKETLYRIATKYAVTIEEIKQLNPEIDNFVKTGQIIIIPKFNKNFVAALSQQKKQNFTTEKELTIHEIQPKETLYSIARLYNVSVADLDELNAEILKNGLRIGQEIYIPNKKKTIGGQARIITDETIFHTVKAQETKYGIAKKYGISIDQLELQNPETITGLKVGTQLAINLKNIEPSNNKEELMIALAEKQLLLEKSKIVTSENAKLKEKHKETEALLNKKTLEVEDLQDKALVQKEMNQKVLRVNGLNVNLDEIDEKKSGSAEKLKLVLEANRDVQDLLLYKLDSLVYHLKQDVEAIRSKEITDLETSKQLEKESYANLKETNSLLLQLKQDLAKNRNNYALIMNKVKQINLEENKIYKKKSRDLAVKKTNQKPDVDDLTSMENEQNIAIKQNEDLLNELEKLTSEKENVLKEKLQKASFYSEESRKFDDKLALVKLNRYKEKVKSNTTNASDISQPATDSFTSTNLVAIEVIENLKEVPNGYYLVVGKFQDAKERDQKIIELINSGATEASFFYNFNTLSYYVYAQTVPNAVSALKFYNLHQNEVLYKNVLIVRTTYKIL